MTSRFPKWNIYCLAGHIFPRCWSISMSFWTKGIKTLWSFLTTQLAEIIHIFKSIWWGNRESLKPFTVYEATESVEHAAPWRIRPRSGSLLCGYHANLFTSEPKLFWRTTGTSSKMESEMNLGLFLWVCFLSAQFHVGTFNHYSPWCEMNEIYSLDISNQYAFSSKRMTEHIIHLPILSLWVQSCKMTK